MYPIYQIKIQATYPTTKDSEDKKAIPQISGESIEFNLKKLSSQDTAAETLKSSNANSSQSTKLSIIRNSSILVKNRKILNILNTSSKDCTICNRKPMMQIIKDTLNKKYMTSRESYNVKVINDIIYNEVSHVVSVFKDYLIYDDISEFLRRIYKITEIRQRLPKVFEFYEKYSKVFPNYVILPESKNMFKNIEKKQKLIDEQQRMAADQNNKRLNLDDSDDDKKIFNTLFLNELNKPGSTYDINESQQATESQLFSYIKNSKAKGNGDNTIEKSFNNLLEKVLLKESMSFANPMNQMNDKKNPKAIIKSCAQGKEPAVCKIKIEDTGRSSCVVPAKEKGNYISHLPHKSKDHDAMLAQKPKPKPAETNIRQSLNIPPNTQRTYSSQSSKPINLKEHFNSVIPSTYTTKTSTAKAATKELEYQSTKYVKENIASPKEMEIKAGENKIEEVIAKELKQESRNVKWQPKEKDHYLTNNIISDPSTRTHSSLKTPKPAHKFTDIDIHKLVNNINANNDRLKSTPMAFKKRNAPPPNSNNKSTHKENVSVPKTDRVSLCSRNSNTQSQSQLSMQGKQSKQPESHDRAKKAIPKDYNGLMLDIESINKHAKEIVNELHNRQIPSTAKTPDCIKQNANTSKSKPSKAAPYVPPQTAKSNNNSNRLLFSKSVSNADKYKYRLEKKSTPTINDSRKEYTHATTSGRASIAQTPGPSSVQHLFKYNKL